MSGDEDEDWERRVADWTAGRRPATTPASSEPASVPASYQPDPAVYEPAPSVQDEPRRRRFALRRPARSEAASDTGDVGDGDAAAGGAADRVSAPKTSHSPQHAAGGPLQGVATWTPDAAAREAAMVVERPDHEADDAPDAQAPDDRTPIAQQPADEPVPAVAPASAGSAAPSQSQPGRLATLATRFRGRQQPADKEDGPFFPPEPDSTSVGPSETARARPRPGRPAADAVPATDAADAVPATDAAGTGSSAPDAPARRRPRPGPGRAAATAAGAAVATSDTEAPATSGTSEADTSQADTPATSDTAPAAAPDAEHEKATADSDTDDTDDTDEKKEKRARERRSWRDVLRASKARRRAVKLVILAVVVVGAALALRTYVVAPYYIPSQSMEPTLHGCPGCNNDHVLVDKLSYRFHDPHAGDIVVFDKPKGLVEPDSVLIKRVVAVGGEKLVLKRGLVYVNGRRVAEPYINKACGAHPSTPETGTSSWLIPTDDVFVMGDNRCNSTDSRTFGPIKESSIVGRAFVIVWPLKRITFF